MRESELLEHIYARSAGLGASAGWGVVAGPGDDAAVMRSPSGDVVLVTVDQLVEGRHYDAGTAIDLIARKAVARSVSDIAAMGGAPAWATATGVLPKGYPHADELFDAMAKWAAHWGCPLVGGDIASHGGADHPLTLTVTIAGAMREGASPVLRSGARAGDAVLITGPVGGSYESGRHLTFDPRLGAGEAAAHAGAHAMIDLSDGLGRDADRVARASGVIIEIEAARVPTHAGLGWREAFAAGEDHELIICHGADRIEGLDAPVIGRCRSPEKDEHPGALVVDEDGTRHDAGGLGWDH